MSQPPTTLTAALADRYRIERELGAGGMATVFLAEDLKHGRRVAIKVLRPELAAVIGAERFVREIRTIAALQHPHILGLIDSGEVNGTAYYVMPYVEGESLRDRLTREKQLPIGDAVRIASEVASALDYAHRHGVIHRDIKPENILLHDNQALVADFGIALAVSSAGGTRMTETGMSLGTPHYMSPEQAMGEREISARSDIYALGVVSYEMLCGEPPFTGPTAQAIIARVMTEEPRPLALQRKSVPPHVESAVRAALEKLPADRMASAAEFAAALANPAYVAASETATRPGLQRGTRATGRFSPLAAALVSGLVLGALGLAGGWLLARTRPVPARRMTFGLALPDSARYVDTFGRSVAVSPDGSALVYSGGTLDQHRLYIRRLDEQKPTPLPGTEGAYGPFFSPDGEWVGFIANQRLMKVRVIGGSPTVVAQLLGNIASGATWSIKDDIVLEDVAGLSQVKASGGKLAPLASLTTRNSLLEWPSFLPDGDAVLCAVSNEAGKIRIAVVTVPGGAVTIFEDIEGSDPRFLAPGTVFWTSPEGVVLAASFDPAHRRFTGKPAPVIGSVVQDFRGSKVAIGPGIVVQVEGTSTRAQLLRVDRHGVTRVELPEGPDYSSPRYSPDGRYIAFISGPLSGDLWVVDRVRATKQRLALSAPVIGPEWTPDGRKLVYGFLGQTSWEIYQAFADGSAAEQPLVTSPSTDFPGGMTADGSLVFWRTTADRGDILYKDAAGVEHPFVATRADERTPTLSPDGHWVAYVSDESGRREVYVRPFPSGSGRWQISSEGGIEPRWTRHGREVVYRDRGWFLAVPVVPGKELTIGRVDSLFHGPYLISGARAQYDVSADGSEFLVVGAPAQARTLSVTINPFERGLSESPTKP